MRWKVLLFLVYGAVSQAFAARPQPDRIPDEWIFSRQTRSPQWREVILAVRNSFQFLGNFGPDNNFALFKLRPGAARALLPRLQGVRVQPNYLYRSSDMKDPDFEKSWALANGGQAVGESGAGIAGKDIGAVKAWEIAKGSRQTVVAILDSGIDTYHEDLNKNLWTNANEVSGNGLDDDGNGYVDDRYGWNFVANSPDVSDDNRHGTFCAGLIGAEAGNGVGSRGVNPEVSLMAVKMLDANGYGTTEAAVRGVQYAVNNGATVLNASWGGSNYDPALFDVVKWAGDRGVLFVAAAGNDFKNNDTDPNPTYPSSFHLPNIISVAAYDNRDNLADFSNYGKNSVHIGAPGVAMFSTIPGGYLVSSGTSFAAPIVSGVAALLHSYVPTLSMPELRDRLLYTSEVIDYYQRDKTTTAGRVHAYNALMDIRPPRPVVPTTWNFVGQNLATPHPYLINTKQTLRVQVPGAKHIRVHFSNFITEACCDSVTIRDAAGRVVANYAGDLGPFTSTDALGDTMDIEFKSDFSMTKYGFEIDGAEGSPEPRLQ